MALKGLFSCFTNLDRGLKRMTHTPNLARNEQTTPERFFNAINSYQLTEAIKSAIELDVFTVVNEGNPTAATIAVTSGIFALLVFNESSDVFLGFPSGFRTHRLLT